jgi:hypothetical protein
MQNFLFLPMNFVSAWLFKNFRMHHVLHFGTLIFLIGCWARLLSVINWNFSILITAQIFALLPNAVYVNCISMLVN